MSEVDFKGLLASGVEAVLETMFFTVPLRQADADAGEEVLVARVAFDGAPSGTLSVRISNASARNLAAAFLGEDEEVLTAVQISLVVCELANMLCGWILSQVEHDRHFNLNAPELLSNKNGNLSELPSTSEESFAIEDGTLTVVLQLDLPHER
jgi:hypothetical protein